MKRSTSNSSNGSYQNKKGRVDEEPTFEEELMMMEQTQGAEGYDNSDSTLEGGAKWSRPMSKIVDPSEQPLVFQWLDIDMTSGDVLEANPSGDKIVGSLVGPVPVVRLYGVTQDGESILACIHGFTPYFYASLPNNADLTPQRLGELRSYLDERVSKSSIHSKN